MSDDDDDDVHCPVEDDRDRLSGGRRDGRAEDTGERRPASALWLNRVRAGVRRRAGEMAARRSGGVVAAAK